MDRAHQPRKQTDRVDLEAELWRAICIGRRVDLLEAVGVSDTLQTIVGCDFVEFRATRHGHFYDLREDGTPALIVGVVGVDESDTQFEITAIDLATGVGVGQIEEHLVAASSTISRPSSSKARALRRGWDGPRHLTSL